MGRPETGHPLRGTRFEQGDPCTTAAGEEGAWYGPGGDVLNCTATPGELDPAESVRCEYRDCYQAGKRIPSLDFYEGMECYEGAEWTQVIKTLRDPREEAKPEALMEGFLRQEGERAPRTSRAFHARGLEEAPLGRVAGCLPRQVPLAV